VLQQRLLQGECVIHVNQWGAVQQGVAITTHTHLQSRSSECRATARTWQWQLVSLGAHVQLAVTTTLFVMCSLLIQVLTCCAGQHIIYGGC
jgi:hypothetical protein